MSGCIIKTDFTYENVIEKINKSNVSDRFKSSLRYFAANLWLADLKEFEKMLDIYLKERNKND